MLISGKTQVVRMSNIFLCFEWKTDQSNFIVFTWVQDRKKTPKPQPKTQPKTKQRTRKTISLLGEGFIRGPEF